MNVLIRLASCCIIPVLVSDDPQKSVRAANAISTGGIDVVEVTLRTPTSLESIREIARKSPDILIGAGTVTTIEQCEAAVAAGAGFIVSPGFDEALVKWCNDKSIAIVPGCVTPSEIMSAIKLGINVVKFFPANIYGGLPAMKALAGPFGNIKFIPTGGINQANLGEYMASPIIHAVGGSWLCTKTDVNAENYEKITLLCREAKSLALGFEVDHLGMNCDDNDMSNDICSQLHSAFGLAEKHGNSSNFAGSRIELMKSPYLGRCGHIAISTNRIQSALSELEKRGYEFDQESAKYDGGKLKAIYLKNEFGGFAVHLLQK